MRALRILFVTHCTSMAGANRSMVQLILELVSVYGCQCHVLLPSGRVKSDGNKLQEVLRKNNIPYKAVDIRYFSTNNNSIGQRLDFLKFVYPQDALCKELSGMNFDIVHSNSSVIDFGGYLSRELGVKHVWHLREFQDFDYCLKSMFGEYYEKLTFENGDVFIAISDAIKKHFSTIIPVYKIHTIYNGIASVDEVYLSNHTNHVVQFFCAGLVMACKNQKEIVYAINELVNNRDIKNLHLTIVGRNISHYGDEIKEYAEKHGLVDYITILEETDGISALASKMDVGITPSVSEAFGRTTVEYMMHNLAVIANDSGANPEIIENGVSGLIYSAKNYVHLADCMQGLIEDRVKMISLAEKGRERALANFQSRFNTKAIYQLYQELCSTPYKKHFSLLMSYRRFVWCKNIIPYKIGILLKRVGV